MDAQQCPERKAKANESVVVQSSSKVAWLCDSLKMYCCSLHLLLNVCSWFPDFLWKKPFSGIFPGQYPSLAKKPNTLESAYLM